MLFLPLHRQLVSEQPSFQKATPEASTTDGEVLKGIPVPMGVLMELSKRIGSKSECAELAHRLGFDRSAIVKLTRSSVPVEAIAHNILLVWSSRTHRTKEGTQLVLEGALLSIGRKDLYDFCKKLCKEWKR